MSVYYIARENISGIHLLVDVELIFFSIEASSVVRQNCRLRIVNKCETLNLINVFRMKRSMLLPIEAYALKEECQIL